MTHKKLLQNVYKAAKYHENSNRLRSNDLSRNRSMRSNDLSRAEAYAYIIQMVVHWDTIGSVDYHKVHKIEEDLPSIIK